MRLKIAVTVLAFCVAALLSLGLVMLYSSSMTDSGSRFIKVQLIWSVIGLTCCVALACIDYKVLKPLALPGLVVSVVLLGLVFAPMVGVHRNGASRWLGYHKVSFFQPSEVAKLALIVALAWYCDRFQRQMPTFKKGIVIPGMLIGLVLGLIFIEPDRGTTILLAGVSATMLLVAGVRWKFLIPQICLALVGLVISFMRDPMRLGRIRSWWHLEEHKTGVGRQAYEAMLALGAGGWTGLGLGNSRQKLGFVSEKHTDFILSIIGEELGLIATALVIVGFICIVLCGIYIAMRAPDTFGLLLGSGISFLIGLQAFINIGVVTSALPNKGLPLPFISYGGSNLVLMLACVGLLLSIARQARELEPVEQTAAKRKTHSDWGTARNPFKTAPAGMARQELS
ncbi:MAG TPA: putative peptidoglycan glycosyltransferase FtsW [Verrucomicrobiae bacterium]|nr:putative peptidoglycan glycosyltransferase FtsW [Verrucomicrobiae bacterium]